MRQSRSRKTEVSHEATLRRCAAEAQTADRKARDAEAQKARLRKEMKRARKAYKAAKDAAKKAAKAAKKAQAQLRACLDDTFRQMAQTLHQNATAESCPQPTREPVLLEAVDTSSGSTGAGEPSTFAAPHVKPDPHLAVASGQSLTG